MTPTPAATRPTRRYLYWELVIVLALSLGKSGIYAIVNLAERYWRDIAGQTVTLNKAQADTQVFDLIYQLLGIFFALVPVALVIYLFAREGRSLLRESGVFGPRRAVLLDWLHGLAIFLIIGFGTLGVYHLSRALNLSPPVEYAAGTLYPHEVLVLILRAFENGILEELIVIAYLFLRAKDLGLIPALPTKLTALTTPTIWVLIATSLIRASYHLYQGIGAGIGNFLMGLLFGAYFLRRGRVAPLIIAHIIIDLVGFLGFRFFGPFLGLGT
ncbi:CPBP family intramembrane glutamic endopeptidase [Micrococcoides hystricis]|uniref:CPBP family intramembrane glutamic endopeptidase n=1 Tax=Micrococcoides hystricis TaxID=1572761 RepID=A0ABV6PCJ8_9MICC